MRNKVAIAGAQELTRGNAPFDNDEYDIWSFADWICYDWLERCSGIFEIHEPKVYMNHPRTPQYWDKLQEIEIPVYMYPVADPRIPEAVLYPMDDVLKLISKGKQFGEPFKLLNCSLTYAMALAILYGYEVIDVYGAELAGASAYLRQAPSFAFWNGLALGHGIELNINCSKGMFVQDIYGFEDNLPEMLIHQYIDKIQEQQRDLENTMWMTKGAMQLAEDLLKRGRNDKTD